MKFSKFLIALMLGIGFLAAPLSPAEAEHHAKHHVAAKTDNAFDSCASVGSSGQIVCLHTVTNDYGVVGVNLTCSPYSAFKPDKQVNGTDLGAYQYKNGLERPPYAQWVGGGAQADINAGCFRSVGMGVTTLPYAGFWHPSCWHIKWSGSARRNNGALVPFVFNQTVWTTNTLPSIC